MDDAELDYLFDLNGVVQLEGALTPAEVDRLNAALDGFPATNPGGWHGRVHCQDHDAQRGLNWQNITEGGLPFEELIDHPSWIDHMKLYVGGEGSFDYHHGPLFIDENFANFRQGNARVRQVVFLS